MKLKDFLNQNHPGINEALVCKSIGEKYSEFLHYYINLPHHFYYQQSKYHQNHLHKMKYF